MTMSLVSTVTVGSGGAANIEFTSIPQTGTDLVLKYSLRGTYSGVSNVGVGFRINNHTGTDYWKKNLRATSSLIQSYSATGDTLDPGFGTGPTATASTFSNSEIYIPNYTSTTAKCVSADATQEHNTSTQYEWFIMLMTGIYNVTSSPITSLKLYSTYGDNWAEYSSASLYTITKGSGGATVS